MQKYDDKHIDMLINNYLSGKQSLDIPSSLHEKIMKSIDSYNVNDIYNMLSIFGMDCFVGITKAIYEPYKELHHHDFYEILYIRKGNFKFKVDEKQYELSPGDIVFVTPSILHVLQTMNNAEAERVVINLNDTYLKKISSDKTDLGEVFKKVDKTKNYCVTLKPEVRILFDKYIASLLQNQVSQEYGADIMYKIKFSQLMILLNLSYDDSLEIDLETENPIIAECVDYIKNNLHKPIVIEDIASFTNLSPSTISHTFKEQTGVSVHKYIIKKKMVLAKHLIKENVSFTEIYERCGFNDYTSFFRCFKKEYGITPKDFRNSLLDTIK